MIAPVVLLAALLLARVGAFVAVLPILGGRQMPALVKIGLTVALAWFWGTSLWDRLSLDPAAYQGGGAGWVRLGIALGREAILGALVGYVFSLFLVPARIAGAYLSQEMGLTFGELVSPTGDGAASPLTVALELTAALLFLGLDGHHVFLGAMADSLTNVPVGSGWPEVGIEPLFQAAGAAQEQGLLLAAPVAGCLFLVTVGLTLVSRAAPQMNLYAVGFPLRLGVGLIALLVLWPGLVAGLVAVLGQARNWLRVIGT